MPFASSWYPDGDLSMQGSDGWDPIEDHNAEGHGNEQTAEHPTA